jgi:hypothetical protein
MGYILTPPRGWDSEFDLTSRGLVLYPTRKLCGPSKPFFAAAILLNRAPPRG